MADPSSSQREVIQQTNQPSVFNSGQQISLSNQPQFHYPHVYVDPVSAAAFYQRQQQQQQQHPQPHTSQPVQLAPSHHARNSQPVTTQAHPYYIPDMATALHQMQLHTMLQLHAHQQTHPNQQPQRPDAQSSQPQQIPHHTTATSQPPVHGVLPPPRIPHALPQQQPLSHTALAVMSNSVPAPQSAPQPVVPEAQMASAYRIGRYTPAERKIRLERYREKRAQRNYNRRVKYDCRKQIADKRRRVQGRFVKREEEMALADSANGTIRTTANIEQHRNSEATDATEEETKLQHPESSGSGSTVRHLEVSVENGAVDTASGERERFCEQSNQMLQTFR